MACLYCYTLGMYTYFKNNTLFKYNTYNCSIMIVFNLFFLFFTIVMTESVRFSFGGGGSSVLSDTTLSVLMLNGLSSQLGSSVWVAVVWIAKKSSYIIF